jgi:hypothetical protein
MARRRNQASSTIDIGLVAKSLRGPGTDTRRWVSYGTVGVIGDDGVFDTTSYAGIAVTPKGVFVDVRLEPSGLPVTARLALGIGSCGHILAPIRPGDEVIVVSPEGDYNTPPLITSILNNAAHKQPLGSDRKPVFKNDRLLIEIGSGYPVEVNAQRINLGDETAEHPATLGDEAKDILSRMLDAINSLTVSTAMGPSSVPLNVATFTAIKNDLDQILSTRTFLKD